MERIIFLDIDGVLNVIPSSYDKYGGVFHKHFEHNLAKIIDITGAKIVISSTWRLSGLDIMKEMWESRNIAGDIIDITPYVDGMSRGEEIRMWLEENGRNVDSYCIIDDDDDFMEEQMDFFVQTSGNKHHTDCIDIGYGLTIECANEAINILNKKAYKK